MFDPKPHLFPTTILQALSAVIAFFELSAVFRFQLSLLSKIISTCTILAREYLAGTVVLRRMVTGNGPLSLVVFIRIAAACSTIEIKVIGSQTAMDTTTT